MAIPRRVWIMSAAALFLYGSISAAINWSHGPAVAARAFAAQGASSFLATFSISTTVDAALVRMPRSWSSSARVLLAAMAGTAVAATQHIVINLVAKTPSLWATVAFPITAAAVYCVVYARVVVRRAQSSSSSSSSSSSPSSSSSSSSSGEVSTAPES